MSVATNCQVSVATRQSYCGTVPTLDPGRVWEESRAVYSRFVHARFERALQAISGLGPVHTAGGPLIESGCREFFLSLRHFPIKNEKCERMAGRPRRDMRGATMRYS